MKKMTPFGKAMRKIRIDRDLLLGEVADMLGVSSSYLSQIETGKKPIPDGLADKVATRIKLTAEEALSLKRDAAVSSNEFTIRLGANAEPADHVLAADLALEFARLTPDAKNRIARALGGIIER
jgi:transcriptional regulator with XRE-family HTH domain